MAVANCGVVAGPWEETAVGRASVSPPSRGCSSGGGDQIDPSVGGFWAQHPWGCHSTSGHEGTGG